VLSHYRVATATPLLLLACGNVERAGLASAPNSADAAAGASGSAGAPDASAGSGGTAGSAGTAGAPTDAPAVPISDARDSVTRSWVIGPSVSAELLDIATDGTNVTLALELRGDIELGGSRFTQVNDNVSLVSYDANGNYAWHRIFEAEWVESLDIEADPAGNLYLAGLVGSITLGAERLPGPWASFVAKLSPTGDPIWTKTFRLGGPALTPFGPRLEVDAQGNPFVTAALGPGSVDFGPGGQLTSEIPGDAYADFTDAFLVKLDTLGNPSWIRKFTRFTGHGTPDCALGVDPSGAFVLSAWTVGALDLGGPAEDCPADASCVTAAGFDAMGNRSWLKQWVSGRGNTYISDPRVTVIQGSAFLTALGSIDFGQGMSAANSSFHVRLDPTGGYAWAGFSTGAAEVSTLASSGAAYVAGTFSKELVVGSRRFVPDTSPNVSHLYYVGYDPGGSQLFTRIFASSETASVRAIVATTTGPWIAGHFYSTLELDRTLQAGSTTDDSSVYVARLAP
jgi:hypothetical protein